MRSLSKFEREVLINLVRRDNQLFANLLFDLTARHDSRVGLKMHTKTGNIELKIEPSGTNEDPNKWSELQTGFMRDIATVAFLIRSLEKDGWLILSPLTPNNAIESIGVQEIGNIQANWLSADLASEDARDLVVKNWHRMVYALEPLVDFVNNDFTTIDDRRQITALKQARHANWIAFGIGISAIAFSLFSICHTDQVSQIQSEVDAAHFTFYHHQIDSIEKLLQVPMKPLPNKDSLTK
jgi:hypothetical protein